MNNHRLDVLEQQLVVLQGEINSVLHEMQVTIQAIAGTYSTALRVVVIRLDELEKAIHTSGSLPTEEEQIKK